MSIMKLFTNLQA